MKSTQNLPVRLKELRKQNNYSQEYVAEQLNISRQAISHWENGKTYPDIDNLVLLAELYHITVDELINDTPIEIQTKPKRNPDKMHIIEVLGIAVIIFLSMLFPFVPIISALVIIFWMRKSGQKHILIYVLCCICLAVGVYNSFIFIIHFTPNHGTSIIQQMQ